MSALIWLRVVAIWLGLLWKAYHLYWRPHDRPLRAVVACFVCFALSTPVQVIDPDAGILGLQPTALAAIEYALIMCASYFIMVFFALRGGRVHTLVAGRWPQVGVLAGGVAVTITLGLLAPASVGLDDYTEPHAVAMYLVSELYIGATLLLATRNSYRVARSPLTGTTQAFGMFITTFGLGLLALATLLLAGVQLGTLSGLGFQAGPASMGGFGLLIGGPLFIVGICYPGFVMRVRSTGLWIRRLREYHRLGPLWRLTSAAFPGQHLRRGIVSPTWDRISTRGVHRRSHRRYVEARDGLVGLSPHIPDAVLPDGSDGASPQRLAPLGEWMVDNAATIAADDSGSRVPKPVLRPAENGPDEDMRVLIALSDAIKLATRKKERHARDQV